MKFTNMSTLLSFYIVDRKSGISYDPYANIGKVLFADSNRANSNGTIVINIDNLCRGLAEKRYRLVPKTLAI